MKAIQTSLIEIALRTLGADERRKVQAWFDHLGNWENDSFVRECSHKLNAAEEVYVLKADGEIRIFFRLEGDRITPLDLATKATLLGFGHLPETGR
jgi:hypothetical protein